MKHSKYLMLSVAFLRMERKGRKAVFVSETEASSIPFHSNLRTYCHCAYCIKTQQKTKRIERHFKRKGSVLAEMTVRAVAQVY